MTETMVVEIWKWRKRREYVVPSVPSIEIAEMIAEVAANVAATPVMWTWGSHSDWTAPEGVETV